MKDIKSCLCCGKVGEPKAWMTNDPSVYVCSRCHRLGNGPGFKATTEEEGDAYTFGFFDGRAEGAKHCDSIQTKYEDAVAQLTKAHNMIDALEKKNNALKEKLYLREMQLISLRSDFAISDTLHSFAAVTEHIKQALAATADLDGLILCHAEPVAFIEKITSRLAPPEDNHYKQFWMCYEPLYRAWEPTK